MCRFIGTTPITPGLRLVSSKIGKSFAEPQSSSLTEASCCSASRTQKHQFSSRREVYQVRQTILNARDERARSCYIK